MSLCLPTASVSSRRVLWVDLHARWVVNGVVFYRLRSVSKRWLWSRHPKEMGSLISSLLWIGGIVFLPPFGPGRDA